MDSKPAVTSRLKGEIWLDTGERPFAREQVDLLEAIASTGSISAAAKRAGISYKTAWDRLDAMNNLAGRALVERSAGGARGGGTCLTPYGEQMLAGFRVLQEEHQRFLTRISERVQSLADVAADLPSLAGVAFLKTSARNQFRGVVERIVPGAVNAGIYLKITSEHSIVAMITDESRQQLDIQVGQSVIALIKAPWVMLASDPYIRVSASNRLVGEIIRITRGAVNADVVMALADGKTISAIITNSSLDELQLQEGQKACAFFDAASVVLVLD